MKRNALIGAIVVSTIGASVFAHNGATGMVMERMNGMTAMRDVMRDLAPMMQGETSFDVRAVQTAGATLMAHAGDNMNKLFPKEPISAASYAREDIWNDWTTFAVLSEDLRTYALGLAEAAPNALTAPTLAKDDVEDAGRTDQSLVQSAPQKETLTFGQLMGVQTRNAESLSPKMQMTGQASETTPTINFANLAADDVFEMVSQTCASCHARFRRGN